MTPIEALLHWVREREAVRTRKESGEGEPRALYRPTEEPMP